MYYVIYSGMSLSLTLLRFEAEREVDANKKARASAKRLRGQGCAIHFVGSQAALKKVLKGKKP